MPDQPLEPPTVEDRVRSQITVRDLIDADLDDHTTPSTRDVGGTLTAGGFDVAYQPRRTLAERVAAGEVPGRDHDSGS